MSHGADSGSSKAEPNLTALLDIVLQLLMFFMMCVNFANEQVNENIQLPVATSARPMEKTSTDVLFLNMNKSGQLEVVGMGDIESLEGMEQYLRDEYNLIARKNQLKYHSPAVNTIIVIRADKSTDYGLVRQLMQMCQKVGFRKLHIRAKTN